MTQKTRQKLSFFGEVLGWSPLPERLRQAAIVLRGAEDVPPANTGLSSLKMLRPRLAWPLWRGRTYIDRAVIISNLFNYRQTPIADGWSVRRTQVEDFRGRTLTYDSHNGTDFAIPVGTPVLAAASGRVAKVHSEFNRGGLKVYLDHGGGLMTTYAHLARAVVREGDVVARGQQIAISGYSGLDGAMTVPFGVPHVHFNTWLNGEPICPFGRSGEASIWVGGQPTPHVPRPEDEDYEPSEYDPEGVEAAITACQDGQLPTAARGAERPRPARQPHPDRNELLPHPLYRAAAPLPAASPARRADGAALLGGTVRPRVVRGRLVVHHAAP